VSIDEEPVGSETYPWPSGTDTVLGPGTDWAVADVAWGRGRWYARIRGFRKAAEILAAEVAKDRREIDGLIFPFLNDWRHHLELLVKAVIIDACRLLDEPQPKSLFGTHRLETLWRDCRPLLERIEPKARADLDNVARVITELHGLDPGGDAFRYPVTTKGDPTLRAVNHFSFAQVTSALEPISNFLQAAWQQVSVELTHKLEMRSALSPEVP
jgi:hypothetical protein